MAKRMYASAVTAGGKKAKSKVRTFYQGAVDPREVTQSFKFNSSTTPTAITSIDSLRSVLTNPQEYENIKRLYQYCDYYVNYDSIVAGAIKNIFIPFSQTPYRLTGGTKKSREFFEKLFEQNNLEDIIRGCANDYFKYANVYLYLNDDYTLQLLPPHRCAVEALAVDGEPIVSFEIDRSIEIGKTDISDLERKYHGYPKVIQDAVEKGGSYAQLPIGNCFSITYSKASWEKYAVPPITAALPWLIEKETLTQTLTTELDNMRDTFLHVRVGDKDKNPIPGNAELSNIGNNFASVLSIDGGTVVTTAWNVQAEFLNGGTKDSLTTIADLMANINWNILSALTISSVLATGDNLPNVSSNANFSTIQAAVTLVNKRINAYLNDLTKMFNKIIRHISAEEGHSKAPELLFDLVDLNNDEGVTELMLDLYDKGFISKQTVYDHTNFSYDEEIEKRQEELNGGINQVLTPPDQPYNKAAGSDEGGRPELDMDERTTDKDGKNENPSPSDSGGDSR